MDVRLLDLDASVVRQAKLARNASWVLPLHRWGPHLRLGCSLATFHRFEQLLARLCGGTCDSNPTLTFLGSGDFHHLSLALLRRLVKPFNLLIIDNHPDWVRGIPFLHCGTWVNHALAIKKIKKIYHVGGNVDFDNHYRYLAPWRHLRSGRIRVVPAYRQFVGSSWSTIPHEPLRSQREYPASISRVRQLLAPWKDELASAPLYISLDRDVLQPQFAVVNWDSGHLTPGEVLSLIEVFSELSAGILGMDVVGDWSRVSLHGLWRWLLHWLEHPSQKVWPDEAQARNESLNLEIVALMQRLMSTSRSSNSGDPARMRPTSISPR